MTYGEVVELVNRSLVVDIFLDFNKGGVDVVNHSIILTKLQMLGIGGKFLSWIHELFGWTMSINFAGKMSSFKEVTSDVLQGSVLGPVLCLIYINSIANFAQCQ